MAIGSFGPLDFLELNEGLSSLAAPSLIWVRPNRGSIDGGIEIAIGSNAHLVNTSEDVSLLVQTLPGGWTTSVAGTGVVTPRITGLNLRSGTTTASSATAISSSTYESFDATLTVEPKVPVFSSTYIVLGAFEFRISSTELARVRLVYVPGVGKAVEATVIVPDETRSQGPIAYFGTAEVTLRIIRHEEHVSLLADDDLIMTFDRFTASTTGTLRISVSNEASTLNVESCFAGVLVRSNALINDVLLLEKQDLADRVISGVLPPTSFREVGEVDIRLFGPWGSLTLTDGFTYTAPEKKTITSSLVTYSDRILRDRSTI